MSNIAVFDKDGDISKATYLTIKNWDMEKGWSDFIDYIEDCFDINYGKIEKTEDEIILITGGWSCNELVIGAIQNNSLFMGLFWEASFRGGKYVFSNPNKNK